MRFLIILLAMVGSQVAWAKDLAVLPSSLSLEGDEEYRWKADYVPPQPVKGYFVHGYAYGWDSAFAGQFIENYSVKRKACPEKRLPTAGEQNWGGLEEFGDPKPDQEFWFFRTGSESLYIGRRWVPSALEDCKLIYATKIDMYRSVQISDRITVSQFEDGKIKHVWTTGLRDPYFGLGVMKALALPNPAAVRSLRDRAAQKGTLKRSKFDGVNQLCWSYWEHFWGGSRCVITQRGVALGLLSSASSEEDTGPSSYLHLKRLSTDALLDGRLFEWDREITLAQQPKAKPAP